VGALELMERRIPPDGPEPPGGDPRFLPGYDPLWWAKHHPLGLERLSHVTIVCAAPERATHVYAEILGGRVLHEAESPLVQTRSTFIGVGDGTVVEVATPTGGESLAAADLKANGDILHAVTWRVADLDRAERHLNANGIRVLDRDATTLIADPGDTFGAPMRFTTWDIPGDTRGANHQ
jgi:catechol 2,3-dioxygenase-like lactoylglutathione lyase family enzyme